MGRGGPDRGRGLAFAREYHDRCFPQNARCFRRRARCYPVRFRDFISCTRPIFQRSLPIIACYTSHQEARVATLRSRSLKQSERNLYCARSVSDSRGRYRGNGVGR